MSVGPTKTIEEMSREELIAELRQREDTAVGSVLVQKRNSDTPSQPPDRDSLFRLLTENSRDMITVSSPDGTLLYVSPVVERMLGYSPEEILMKPAFSFIPSEDTEALRSAVADALKKGTTEFSVEHKVIRAGGAPLWVETRGVLFLSAGNELVEMHCAVRDVDARKSAEDRLSMMTGAIENMSVPVYWIGKEGRILYVNRAACESLGYTVEELCALTLWDVDPDYPRDKWHIEWERLRDIKHTRFETRHRAKDGRTFPVEVLVDHTLVGDREVQWAFVRDISPLKTAEEAMQQMEQRLRQAEKMEAIGLLAGGIAHDFNNQLAGLLGYADLLRDEVHDSALVEYADAIILGIKRAAGLTEQLLAFSRRGKYVSVPVNLNIIVKEVDSILRHTIDKRIVIRNRRCAGEDALTLGDPSQLQNAVLNLAINARDAMPNGGTLSFTTEKCVLDAGFCDSRPYALVPGNYVKVAVKDTGIGMSEEVRDRAFEPFFTTKEKGKGTGMGLAAVYGTIKNHKGAVEIFSTVGKGTEVVIYLPSAESAEAADDVPKEVPAVPKEALKVLLVEDEEVLMDVAGAMLRRMGCEVTVCSNGSEAVTMYENVWREIDLVILDMVMPVMNGRQAFSEMQRINPNIVAVLASGYSLEGDAQAMIDEGVRGFIQKPYRKNDLARIITEVVP